MGVGPSPGCSASEAANYLIDNTKRGLPIYGFVCKRIVRKRRTDLWEIIKLIETGDKGSLDSNQGCTGVNYYTPDGTPRIALCELSDWVEDLLVQLYHDRIELLKQGVPTEVYIDIVRKEN